MLLIIYIITNILIFNFNNIIIFNNNIKNIFFILITYERKVLNSLKLIPEAIPKYIYNNASNRNLNSRINEAILKHKEKYKKIEIHESHNNKQFLRNDLQN